MTNAANNILMPHHDTGSGEVEFYKTETEMDNLNKKRHGSGSVSSGGSANQDDFDDEEGPINRIIGRTTSFYKFFRLHHTMSDVPLLNTTVMSHNDGQRIALLTKLFCMSKVATFSGRF